MREEMYNFDYTTKGGKIKSGITKGGKIKRRNTKRQNKTILDI